MAPMVPSASAREAARGRCVEGSTGPLSIVKRIAERHGGRAEAASAGPGRGATFSVRFPNEAVALP